MRTVVAVSAALVIAINAAPAGAQVRPGGQTQIAPLQAPKLESPARLAATPDGMLVVSDYGQKAIVIVELVKLSVVSVIPTKGRVTGIAATTDRIYVGNQATGGIEIYSRAGTLQGFLGGADQYVLDAKDLVIDQANNRLYAIDGIEKNVKVFDLAGNGRLIQTIAGPGLLEENLHNPTGLALNLATSEVYISDFGEIDEGADPRVVIFGLDGTYHESITGNGGAQGYFFSKPQGLAIGETGHVFVVDSFLGQVVVMDRATGDVVTRIGEHGSEAGQLRLPVDVVIVGDNRDLMVLSNRNRRVESFPGGGQN